MRLKISKSQFKCGFGFRFRLEKEATWQTQQANSTGKLGAPDTENMAKWQSNDTQGAVMQSGLLSKKTH